MSNIRSIFVEKKQGFNVEAQSLLRDFKENLGLTNLEDVRIINKYVISDISEEYYTKSLHTIFAAVSYTHLDVYKRQLLRKWH